MEEKIDDATYENPVEIQDKTSWYKSNSKVSYAGFFAGLLVLVIAAGSLTAGIIKNNDKAKNSVAVSEKNNFHSNGTIIYGYWTSSSSIINAYDLSSGKEAALATLGKDVKHIKIINNHEIIYINKTDQRDYGKELVIRDIENNADRTVIVADTGFGIDDYAVSPNGQYAAVWMVGNSTSSVQFIGNPSRVYTVNISNNEKHLIYDESSENGQKVHYPIAITNNGKLFTDRFLPNSGAGWAYGMSVSDFTGTTKKDIDSMKNGTYSTQPAVSPDGKYLAFAGYDGADGAIVVDGFRKGLTSNTVELFDLTTQSRERIDKRLSNVLYSSVSWDQLSEKLIYATVEKLNEKVARFTYSYDTTTYITIKLPDTKTLDTVALIDDGSYLLTEKIQDNSGLGNLGSRYSQGFNKLFVMDASSNQTTILIQHTPIQFIAMKPSRFFPAIENKGINASSSLKQLKLQTFVLKPELPKRSTQQSEPKVTDKPTPNTDPGPRCKYFFVAPCNKLLGTNYTSRELYDCAAAMLEDINSRVDPSIIRYHDNVDRKYCKGLFDSGFERCAVDKQSAEACYDSPLYLYGKNGTSVNVTVDTFTSNSNVLLANNAFNATLADGKIRVGSSLVDSINFDYESRVRKLLPPTSGYVFKNENVVYEVEKIASRFELNFNETQDLLNFTKKITSPFVFVSFYDQEMSHNILPLYFNPIPDNYRNIVFYFRKLDKLPPFLPNKPTIEPVKRGGFTAIEISYILR